VCVWSSGLDLWGILNQKTNTIDSLWTFPEKNARERVTRELGQMQQLLDEVGLAEQIGTLVPDDDFKDIDD
jgi:hypothetical protein